MSARAFNGKGTAARAAARAAVAADRPSSTPPSLPSVWYEIAVAGPHELETRVAAFARREAALAYRKKLAEAIKDYDNILIHDSAAADAIETRLSNLTGELYDLDDLSEATLALWRVQIVNSDGVAMTLSIEDDDYLDGDPDNMNSRTAATSPPPSPSNTPPPDTQPRRPPPPVQRVMDACNDALARARIYEQKKEAAP